MHDLLICLLSLLSIPDLDTFAWRPRRPLYKKEEFGSRFDPDELGSVLPLVG